MIPASQLQYGKRRDLYENVAESGSDDGSVHRHDGNRGVRKISAHVWRRGGFSAVFDRLNESLGPGLETQAPEETQDPDEPQGPALGQEKEDKQDV